MRTLPRLALSIHKFSLPAGYCFGGLGGITPAGGFFGFRWAVFFGGGFTNRLKQLRRSSSSFTKRQSCTDLAGLETGFGAGSIFSS
jgi:hypothetical protein